LRQTYISVHGGEDRSKAHGLVSDGSRIPITLLSVRVDLAYSLIERLLRTSGASSFKIREAESIFELLDLIVLEGRAALVRSSTRRISGAGVVYKQLADSPTLDCARVWRADNRNSRLLSLADAIYAFSQATASTE
jgi:hypothetical protein